MNLENDTTQPMTPLERVEALYEALTTHYGDGEDREIRAAAKLLLVAIDKLQRFGGPNWRRLINEFVEIAAYEPEKFELILRKDRAADEESPSSGIPS
jgi:hypothetical protein